MLLSFSIYHAIVLFDIPCYCPFRYTMLLSFSIYHAIVLCPTDANVLYFAHVVFRVDADAQLFGNVLEFEFMDIDLGLPLNVLN